MDIKDFGAWLTIAGVVGTALFGIWKKCVKPIVKAVRQYFDIVENSSRIALNTHRINSLIHLAYIPLFEADVTGGFTNVNQALIELFGANNENELLGFGWINFIVKEEKSYFRSDYLNTIVSDEEANKTFTIENRKTQQRTYCNLVVCINRGEKNGIINILGKVTVIK